MPPYHYFPDWVTPTLQTLLISHTGWACNNNPTLTPKTHTYTYTCMHAHTHLPHMHIYIYTRVWVRTHTDTQTHTNVKSNIGRGQRMCWLNWMPLKAKLCGYIRNCINHNLHSIQRQLETISACSFAFISPSPFVPFHLKLPFLSFFVSSPPNFNNILCCLVTHFPFLYN